MPVDPRYMKEMHERDNREMGPKYPNNMPRDNRSGREIAGSPRGMLNNEKYVNHMERYMNQMGGINEIPRDSRIPRE